MIEILSNGVLNAVQDCGRRGWLSSGVSLGGAMDAPALRAANVLAGNDPDAAGIEVQLFPFRLRALSGTVVAVTGADCGATIDDVALPPWWAAPMREGQTLTLNVLRGGARAYVAFAGGIDIPAVLGSRSTDLRGGFGGHEGRALARGDRLPLAAARLAGLDAAGWGAAPPERRADGRSSSIRVIPAAEHGAFTESARRAFTTSSWRVTREANRMGYRLGGPELALESPLELFSHGILPGTVQVPPSGQPIIQLADANTCGGYPKIAAVIEADLWRLAQAPAGAELRFALVDQGEAVAALREQARWLADLVAARDGFRWIYATKSGG